MVHLTSSLAKTSAAFILIGLAACADNPPANQPGNAYAPTPAQQNPSGSSIGRNGAPGSTDTPASATDTATSSPAASPPTFAGTGTTTSGSMGSTMGRTMPQGGFMAQSGPMGQSSAPDASSLDDMQIAAIVVAINQGEIQEAQLAQSKARSSDVKTFATHMATMHQAMLAQAQKDATAASITPSDSAMTQQLQADVQTQMSALQQVNGKDFDRTYMDDQVQGHQEALDLIDKMLPNVKSSRLKASLQGARTKVEAHLKDAKAIQQKLPGS